MKCYEKESLGIFPTPLQKLENISRLLNTNVWIKRDDLCGVALGGNKVRKLEYLLHDAKKQGYDFVMTTGQAQSNHAMLTAACALKMGMDCILVLKKRGITSCKGNQILNHLMGVQVHYVDSDSYDDVYAEMDVLAEKLGRKVYKIPCGGSNALGTLGYVDCMKEIAKSGVHFDHIVCACGSGGTAAGTVLGAKLYLPEASVMCAMVDHDPFDEIVMNLIQETSKLLQVDPGKIFLDLLDMCGPGYSIPSKEGIEAMEMMMKHEGIVLDTCYTGKAFAGLIQRAKEGQYGPDDHVLFVHTGGAAGLFAQDWENIKF